MDSLLTRSCFVIRHSTMYNYPKLKLIWNRPSKFIIIIWQEWQTRISYLISLSPLLFENIAWIGSFLLHDDVMIWWSSYMITWWSSYNNLTIIIWRTDQHIIFDNHESPTFRKYSICLILIALWWYDDHHKIIWWSSYEDMMTLTYPYRKYMVCMV